MGDNKFLLVVSIAHFVIGAFILLCYYLEFTFLIELIDSMAAFMSTGRIGGALDAKGVMVISFAVSLIAFCMWWLIP